MAASLKGIDPWLRQYLKVHRLPDIYEALLSGLAVMCPDDPHQFIIDKLRCLQLDGLHDLQWDSFIDESMKPVQYTLAESNLDSIFNFDENTQRILEPTPEMYEKAYNHYNIKLKSVCFNSWMQFHLRKLRKEKQTLRRLQQAALHHKHRIFRMQLSCWKQWVAYRKGRQTMAFNKVQHVYRVAVGRVIFKAWHAQALDSRMTREYFERLERGDNMEEDEMMGNASGEARDDISMLTPKRLAIKIFSYVDVTDLARCACVCRSWKVMTQASALWTWLDLSKVQSKNSLKYRMGGVTDHVATRLLLKCRPYLIHLNLRGCQLLGEETFYCIRECRNLQELNVSECPSVTDEMLKLVTEGCKFLLYLNVSHTQITDASLRTIARNCGNLQYLSLAFCQRFTDRGLEYVGSGNGAKKLVYIDLSGCQQVTPNGFAALAAGCTQLQSFILNDLFTLDDLCVKSLLEKCKNVTTLSLLGSPNITDESIKKLATSRRLHKIKVESNQKLTDAAWKQVGRQCPELYHLSMTDCQRISDLSLKCLSACRNLTIINLADCVRISDTGIRHITESPCASRLRELNLTNCVRLGDMALVNIHKRCHSLAYLSICFCEHISEAGIELLGQTHSLSSLDISGCRCSDVGLSGLGNNPRFKDVSLSECDKITDLGLQKFAQQCTDIERLDLSHCQLITDGAIKNLAFCCRMVTWLNLAGCKLLTDLSVQYLSGVCHYLRHLDVSGSLHLTDKSLRYLRKGCKSLTQLVLLYCKHISKHGANKMLKYVRHVEYSDEDVPLHYNY